MNAQNQTLDYRCSWTSTADIYYMGGIICTVDGEILVACHVAFRRRMNTKRVVRNVTVLNKLVPIPDGFTPGLLHLGPEEEYVILKAAKNLLFIAVTNPCLSRMKQNERTTTIVLGAMQIMHNLMITYGDYIVYLLNANRSHVGRKSEYNVSTFLSSIGEDGSASKGTLDGVMNDEDREELAGFKDRYIRPLIERDKIYHDLFAALIGQPFHILGLPVILGVSLFHTKVIRRKVVVPRRRSHSGPLETEEVEQRTSHIMDAIALVRDREKYRVELRRDEFSDMGNKSNFQDYKRDLIKECISLQASAAFNDGQPEVLIRWAGYEKDEVEFHSIANHEARVSRSDNQLSEKAYHTYICSISPHSSYFAAFDIIGDLDPLFLKSKRRILQVAMSSNKSATKVYRSMATARRLSNALIRANAKQKWSSKPSSGIFSSRRKKKGSDRNSSTTMMERQGKSVLIDSRIGRQGANQKTHVFPYSFDFYTPNIIPKRLVDVIHEIVSHLSHAFPADPSSKDGIKEKKRRSTILRRLASSLSLWSQVTPDRSLTRSVVGATGSSEGTDGDSASGSTACLGTVGQRPSRSSMRRSSKRSHRIPQSCTKEPETTRHVLHTRINTTASSENEEDHLYDRSIAKKRRTVEEIAQAFSIGAPSVERTIPSSPERSSSFRSFKDTVLRPPRFSTSKLRKDLSARNISTLKNGKEKGGETLEEAILKEVRSRSFTAPFQVKHGRPSTPREGHDPTKTRYHHKNRILVGNSQELPLHQIEERRKLQQHQNSIYALFHKRSKTPTGGNEEVKTIRMMIFPVIDKEVQDGGMDHVSHEDGQGLHRPQLASANGEPRSRISPRKASLVATSNEDRHRIFKKLLQRHQPSLLQGQMSKSICRSRIIEERSEDSDRN